jgi:diacylglycerol kinase family enzyme
MVLCHAREQRDARTEYAVIVRDQEAHLSSHVATLIHNPTAGDGRPTRKDIEKILADAGIQVRYQSTKLNWKKAVDGATDLVVAAGGDGTVAKVFRHVAGRDIPVGVLAVGTANNLARSLGLLGDAKEMVAGWKLTRTRAFDVGLVSRPGSDEPRRFVEACGGGLFVDLIKRGPQEVEQGGALVGSEHDRALTLIRLLIAEVPVAHWGVEVDGQDHSGDYIAAEALLIRLTGPGIPLAAQARPDDGVFDVALVRDEDRQTLLDYIDRRLAHEEHSPPNLDVARGRHVVLRPPGKTVRVDDDLVEVGDSVELNVMPGAVRYLVAEDSN